jgi:hypothetical protein
MEPDAVDTQYHHRDELAASAAHSYRDREHLLELAARCERGADELTADAADPAAALAARGYTDLPPAEVADFGDRHRAAAAAARAYAAELRAQAEGMTPAERPTAERVAQAEKVADAANLGGILIDGRRLAESAAASPWNSPETRQVIVDHQQAEEDAVNGSGRFEHIAEPGQVPFWLLRDPAADTTDEPASCTPAVRDVADADEA